MDQKTVKEIQQMLEKLNKGEVTLQQIPYSTQQITQARIMLLDESDKKAEDYYKKE